MDNKSKAHHYGKKTEKKNRLNMKITVIPIAIGMLCIIFTNPSARARYNTRSIFKRSLTGLNSEFSFS